MPLSPLPASRSVSPGSTRVVSEQAVLIDRLLGVAQQLASQHQSLAEECHKEAEARGNLLASKDAEIERILIAEVDLRQDHEQQLTVERQQWCLEKDTLQKVLQEQQGTAHTLEQHLNTQIADLQANLASSKLSQEAAARMHYDTLAALQTANEQLQQQQSKLEQDLKAALAYRHKCIQQKQELQLLHEQVDQAQHSSAPDVASEEQLSSDQQLELISQQQPHDAGLVDDAVSQEDIKTQVAKLKRERELVKRAYNEEKKKADRYRNAYTQLRDLKQPAQRRSRQRSASGAQSMPQLAGLTRQHQGNAAHLATGESKTAQPAAAPACTSSKLQKPFKARKGPTSHNCFTAEMDLAAAGLLRQAVKPPVEAKATETKLQQGLSWPFRNKRVLQQPQEQIEQSEERQQQQPVGRHPWQQQELWQQPSRPKHHKQGSSSQELSPGAKQALILLGLLSEEQEPRLDDNITQDPALPVELPSISHQQPAVPARSELQPLQDRLAGHAEGIQQLDRDSMCRLSDPCQQPSKRSRSCPPDSFGAEPHRAGDSTDAMHGVQNDDPISDDEDAMSDLKPGQSKSGEALPEGVAELVQVQAADEQHRPAPAASHLGCAGLAYPHATAAQAAHQQDSLDMTQPNLTPAGQRPKQQSGLGQGQSDPRTAPIQPFLCISPSQAASDLDPDLDCGMLPAADHIPAQLHPAAAYMQTQNQKAQQQQQEQVSARQTSALTYFSKPKPAKWKQKAGQRAATFVENDQPVLASEGVVRQQGDRAQQCWLQEGAGLTDASGALGETAQQARVGVGFKYQEVVRGKADRAALQGIQCLDCRHFYEAVNTWGHEGQALPACGHTVAPGAPISRGLQPSAAAPVQQGLHQDASRHRYRFAPPATPNGFWDMGFGDSQDSRM